MGRFGNALARKIATELTNATLGYNSRGRPIRKKGGSGCLVILLIFFFIFGIGITIVLALIK